MRGRWKKGPLLVTSALLCALLSALGAASCNAKDPAGSPSGSSDGAAPEPVEAAVDADDPPDVALRGEAGSGPTCPSFGRGPEMVDLGAVCIDSTEVTVAQYRAFIGSKPSLGLLPSACSFKTGYSPVPASGDAYPVADVDWCDAYAFCSWAGKHLCGKVGGGQSSFGDFADPAKNQWQRACSDNGAHVYAYGDAFDGGGRCNDVGYAGDGGGAPIPVKEAAGCVGRAAPAAGVYDMAGNVWEWEDGCETGVDGGAAGSDDRCRTRGGAFDGSETETRCDFDTFTKRAPTRGSKGPDTGLRCCSR